MKKILAFMLLVAMPSYGANYKFGNTSTAHTTNIDMTTCYGLAGGAGKILTYYAQTGDMLDSLWVYARSTSGGTESLAVALYTLTSTTRTLASRVFIDTIESIGTTAGYFGIDVSFAMTAKTWYAIAVCTTTTSAVDLYANPGPGTWPARLGDVETSSSWLPTTWGSATDQTTWYQFIGSVTQAEPGGSRKKVTYVSDTDTSYASSTTEFIINKPGSMSNGDLLVAFICKADGVDASAISPPDATWIAWHESSNTVLGDDHAVWIGWHYVENAVTEPSTYTWTGDNEEWTGGIACFRNVDINVLLDCTPTMRFDQGVIGGDPVCRSITTLTDSCMIFIASSATLADTGSCTDPSGFTNLWFRKNSAGAPTVAAYKMQAAKGATGEQTFTLTDASTGDCNTVTLALRPKDDTPVSINRRRSFLSGGP